MNNWIVTMKLLIWYHVAVVGVVVLICPPILILSTDTLHNCIISYCCCCCISLAPGCISISSTCQRRIIQMISATILRSMLVSQIDAEATAAKMTNKATVPKITAQSWCYQDWEDCRCYSNQDDQRTRWYQDHWWKLPLMEPRPRRLLNPLLPMRLPK